MITFYPTIMFYLTNCRNKVSEFGTLKKIGNTTKMIFLDRNNYGGRQNIVINTN